MKYNEERTEMLFELFLIVCAIICILAGIIGLILLEFYPELLANILK